MEEDSPNATRELQPLQYHLDLVDYLRKEEPHVWAWASSATTLQQQSGEVREAMLRQTYRLEPEGHPAVFAACAQAMERLELDAPATLYQAADGAMNAALYYIPGEVHLVFSGPTLERLGEAELLALLGHELAHYKLWSAEGGAFYNASRILDLALSYPEAKPSHRETARLLSLHTELYADRGAAIAVGDLAPAVSMLVKVMTGLTTVDPAAYLRQARELEASNRKSAGQSHPESFLRAKALELWWQNAEELEDWLDRRMRGPLSIEALDLLQQRELTRLTRGLFAHFTGRLEGQDEEVLTQVRGYFPEFAAGEEPLDLERISAERIDDPTRDYFIALMFDCAMADPDASDEAMTLAAKLAESIGALDQFKAALKRDLKWSKKASDALFARAAKAA
jgi:hypothetical protein